MLEVRKVVHMENTNSIKVSDSSSFYLEDCYNAETGTTGTMLIFTSSTMNGDILDIDDEEVAFFPGDTSLELDFDDHINSIIIYNRSLYNLYIDLTKGDYNGEI